MSKVGKLKIPIRPVRIKPGPKNLFRTTIEAGSASAGPPLGPLLGQYGLNISNFCKTFNTITKDIKPGIPLPVTVRIKSDKSFKIDLHTPDLEYYLMQAAGITRPKYETETTCAGKITIKHVFEIAKIKHEDPFEKYQLYELEQVVNRVMLIARNLGIEVVRDLDPDEYNTFLEERNKYLEELDKILEEERIAKFNRT